MIHDYLQDCYIAEYKLVEHVGDYWNSPKTPRGGRVSNDRSNQESFLGKSKKVRKLFRELFNRVVVPICLDFAMTKRFGVIPFEREQFNKDNLCNC